MNERFEPEFSGAPEIAGGVRVHAARRADSTLQGEGRLRICAWCRRVPLREDHWVKLDLVSCALKMVSQGMVDQATYGVCPDCFNDFLSGMSETGSYSAAAEVSNFTTALA
jgi:hypothetical protein